MRRLFSFFYTSPEESGRTCQPTGHFKVKGTRYRLRGFSLCPLPSAFNRRSLGVGDRLPSPHRLLPLIFLVLSLHSFAQDPPKKIDSNYNNTYYQGRMELFNSLTPPKNAIVFLGNSITERGAWGELLPGQPIMNRGIGGDNTFGVLARLEGVAKAKPKKLFLLIGINDLSRGLPKEVIINNYHRILSYLISHTPKTKIYIQSVLPLYEPFTKEAYLKNKKDSILQLNAGIKQVAEQYHIPYINLHELFADVNGDLKKELTADGIHLRPAAYVMWVEFLKKKKYL